MNFRISLSPRRTALILVVAGCMMSAANLMSDLLTHRYNIDDLWPITRQFDFSQEANFANWYQSVTLLICSALLAAVAAVTKRSGGPFYRRWVGLACIFLFVSIDEGAQIHETTIAPLVAYFAAGSGTATTDAMVNPERNSAATAGEKHRADDDKSGGEAQDKIAWLPVYLAVLAILCIVYLPLFLRLPPMLRLVFVVAGVLYVGGAAGVEKLYSHFSERYGDQALVSQLVSNLSELMEMLGVAAFVFALMTLLGQIASGIEFRTGPVANSESQSPG